MNMFQTQPPLRALVVDDDPVVSAALSMTLSEQGFETQVVSHPDDALEADIPTPALAIIDIILPDMDGVELGTRLRQRWPSLDIIFASTDDSTPTVIRTLQMGASDFLVKPFTPADLRLCLSRFFERQALKQRAARAERRHYTLVQNIPLLIMRLHDDLSLDFVNRAVSSMLGFSAQEALEHDNWLLGRIHERDRVRVEKILDRAFDSAYPLTVQCRMAHRKGFDVHGILKTMPVQPGAEEQRELDCIFVDISERVHLEHSQRQDAKLQTIDAISEEMAHEIRNPLTSIGGFARRLSAKAPDFMETEIILRESKRLEGLLTRIRGYLNPVTVQSAQVDINHCLGATLGRLSEGLRDEGITLRPDIEPELPQVTADPDVLDRVFTILLQDATRALARLGTLNIRTFTSDTSVNVCFDYELSDLRDIDPERLYLPYEDGGFGLPNCYRMVKQMGGVLSMTRENGSAVFTLTLPRHGQALAAEEAQG